MSAARVEAARADAPSSVVATSYAGGSGRLKVELLMGMVVNSVALSLS